MSLQSIEIEMNVLDRLLNWLKYKWGYHQYQKVVDDEKQQEIVELIEDTMGAMGALRKVLIRTYGYTKPK